jgi:hypothetical protein
LVTYNVLVHVAPVQAARHRRRTGETVDEVAAA